MNRLVAGMVAGAVGTTVINIATNADMAIRRRPASGVPEATVEPVAEKVGLVAPGDDHDHDDADQSRLTGLGAMSGALTGVATGVVTALVRPRATGVPAPVAGVVVGLAAMALTDAAATVTGATDPRSWGATSWLADVVPHVLYGLATVGVVDLLERAGS